MEYTDENPTPEQEMEMMDELYADVHQVFCEDDTVVSLIRKFEDRSADGMVSYGQSMADNKGDLKYWLINAQEEAMDLCLYLTRAIEEMEKAG